MNVRLPIFPLPEVTLFPHTLLPLHIFETRYRQMLTDVLAGPKRLAVVGLKPGFESSYEGKPPVYPVAGAGRIVQWERLPSGRYNILLQGEERIRIAEELPTDTLYRLVRAQVLDDVFPSEGADSLNPLVDRVKRSAVALVELFKRDSGPIAQALAEAEHAGIVADRAAAALIPDFELRQHLLETTGVMQRLRRVAEALDHLLFLMRGQTDSEEP